jgi:mRNA interferase HigB
MKEQGHRIKSCVAGHLIVRYSCCMHVISRKTLRQFWEQHPDSESALVRWFKIMQRQDFASFETVWTTFPTADKVGDFIVFNIGGNKYRLITAIHFNRRKVYIRHVLTHQEYDRGAWKP